jgi:hypothetical protein
MDGITLALSGNTAADNSAASLKYTSGSLAIVIGHNAMASQNTWNGMSVGTTLGTLAVKAMVANKNGTSSNGVGATFDATDLGLGSVTLAFANREGQTNSWGVNMSKDLGGLTLNAEWVTSNGSDTASAGITMGF